MNFILDLLERFDRRDRPLVLFWLCAFSSFTFLAALVILSALAFCLTAILRPTGEAISP